MRFFSRGVRQKWTGICIIYEIQKKTAEIRKNFCKKSQYSDVQIGIWKFKVGFPRFIVKEELSNVCERELFDSKNHYWAV